LPAVALQMLMDTMIVRRQLRPAACEKIGMATLSFDRGFKIKYPMLTDYFGHVARSQFF
jgi:hypothetical protein